MRETYNRRILEDVVVPILLSTVSVLVKRREKSRGFLSLA